MEIRKANIEDICIIKNLAEAIWPICYKEIITTAQISYMLDMMYSETSLTAQIEKGHQFIIACENDLPIGFSSYSKKSDEEPTIFRLHKLYVKPSLHRKGMGSALLAYVCTEVNLLEATQLELNVNKQNPAKDFYFKKGFSVLREEVLVIGDGFVMDDYVMILNF